MTSIRYPSPLRYPGGKATFAPWLVDQAAGALGVLPEIWLEPFGGGAGAAIAAVTDHDVPEAWLVETNPGLAAFWTALLDRDDSADRDRLIRRVGNTAPTLALFDAARDMLQNPEELDRGELAYAAFILNRCSRSGIVAPSAGPIGGRRQDGKYRIGDRFHPGRLADRLTHAAQLAGRLRAFTGDGIAFVEDLPESGAADDVFVFADPPYVAAGPRLYAASFGGAQHRRLAGALEALDGPWLCTYDAADEIPGWYAGSDLFEHRVRHTAATHRRGHELVIAPRGMLQSGILGPTGGVLELYESRR